MGKRRVWMLAFAVLPLLSGEPGPSLRQSVEALQPTWVTLRRHLHQYPELSFKESKTSHYVAQYLTSLGLEVRTGVGGNGVVALLKGGKPGPVIALRADMDALPIQEVGDKPYLSKHPGVMHACGHDAHMTIGLGTATVLAQHKDQLPGTVKFLFQPGEEEVPPGGKGGAATLIDAGALENPRPQAIFGLHVTQDLTTGHMGYASQGTMAASDLVDITIKGRLAHGAAPHKGVDAVLVAAEVVQALQSIRSRKVDPKRPLVLTLGTIHGGAKRNIIADEVKLEGTFRTLDHDTRQIVLAETKSIVENIAAAHHATCTVTTQSTTPLVYNDPALTSASLVPLKKVLGEKNVEAVEPWMASEDFACYQQHVPGFFFFLGVRHPDNKVVKALHTNDFDVDEAALGVGIHAMSQLVWDTLERLGKEVR